MKPQSMKLSKAMNLIKNNLKRTLILCLAVFSTNLVIGQNTLEYFGYRQEVIEYGDDLVDILIKSKKGEEDITKPLFFFVQGSTPRPLIFKKDNGDLYPVTYPWVFPPELLDKFHLVTVSKPFIPLIVHRDSLGHNDCYLPDNGHAPKEFIRRDYREYHVKRNIYVLKELLKEKWTSSNQLVLAGHSQGSSVATIMSTQFDKITHLIYSGGNPFGQIMSQLLNAREKENDSTRIAKWSFEQWQRVVDNPNETETPRGGDSNKNISSFSQPILNELLTLKIPTLVTYGTRDNASPFNDYLRIEAMRLKKDNINFLDYIGTEHNFFPKDSCGNVDYKTYNWDKVIVDWLEWVKSN